MSDNDLIRRGDALAEIRRIFGGLPNWVADAIAALPAVAAPDPALRPTMTDMMVDPDTLDAFMEANPLPPDPAAIREAALRDALDALSWTDLFGRTDAEKHVALEQYCLDRDAILALIKKGAADA